MIDTRVKIGNLTLQNPILLASGTVGYGNEISEFIDLSKIGAIITKSISLMPRIGNPPPRITETPSGMINAIGLANVGLEKFIKEKIPFLEKLSAPIICNIAASTYEEYETCVKELNSISSIKAFEINVSCPNVKEGGLEFGNNVNAVRKITEMTKNVSTKPIIIKLSPNVSRISELAKAAKEGGADAVSAINTIVAAAFDIYTRKPKIKNITGGLSGPAIKPIAVAKILEIHRNVDIPIIGIGGITSWQDAAELMIAGAKAVQIGSANFIDPEVSLRILDGLINYAKMQGFNKLEDITGSYILD